MNIFNLESYYCEFNTEKQITTVTLERRDCKQLTTCLGLICCKQYLSPRDTFTFTITCFLNTSSLSPPPSIFHTFSKHTQTHTHTTDNNSSSLFLSLVSSLFYSLSLSLSQHTQTHFRIDQSLYIIYIRRVTDEEMIIISIFFFLTTARPQKRTNIY